MRGKEVVRVDGRTQKGSMASKSVGARKEGNEGEEAEKGEERAKKALVTRRYVQWVLVVCCSELYSLDFCGVAWGDTAKFATAAFLGLLSLFWIVRRERFTMNDWAWTDVSQE